MVSAELAAVREPPPPESGVDVLARLRRAVDLPRLIEAGYDSGACVIRPPADHPVFGYRLCPVAGCMAAVSLETGRRVAFDPDNLEIV